jgi:hypothetical protein
MFDEVSLLQRRRYAQARIPSVSYSFAAQPALHPSSPPALGAAEGSAAERKRLDILSWKLVGLVLVEVDAARVVAASRELVLAMFLVAGHDNAVILIHSHVLDGECADSLCSLSSVDRSRVSWGCIVVVVMMLVEGVDGVRTCREVILHGRRAGVAVGVGV